VIFDDTKMPGKIKTSDGEAIDADASMENEPGFLFEGLALADGAAGVAVLSKDGHTMEFIRDQHRHCKMSTISEIAPNGSSTPKKRSA